MDLETFKEKLFRNNYSRKTYWYYLRNNKKKIDENEDLISYIQYHFQEVEYKDISQMRNNLKVLKKLDDELVSITIAKMNMLIENYKGLSQVSFIFSVVISALILYADILSPLILLSFSENVQIKNPYMSTALTSIIKIVLTLIVVSLAQISSLS